MGFSIPGTVLSTPTSEGVPASGSLIVILRWLETGRDFGDSEGPGDSKDRAGTVLVVDAGEDATRETIVVGGVLRS